MVRVHSAAVSACLCLPKIKELLHKAVKLHWTDASVHLRQFAKKTVTEARDPLLKICNFGLKTLKCVEKQTFSVPYSQFYQ